MNQRHATPTVDLTPPDGCDWGRIVAWASIAALAVCLGLTECYPVNENQVTLSLLIGFFCGVLLAAVYTSARRAEKEAQEVQEDGRSANDGLWPVSRFDLAAVVFIITPALAIWIFPLRWWPHGAFYYSAAAVGAFVTFPALRRQAENGKEKIVTAAPAHTARPREARRKN